MWYSWEPPPERVELSGYHVCVNGSYGRPGSEAPPTAVLENLDLQAGPLWVSVQAPGQPGWLRPAALLLAAGGPGWRGPRQLRVHRLTARARSPGCPATAAWPMLSTSTGKNAPCPPQHLLGHLLPPAAWYPLSGPVEAQLPPRGPGNQAGEARAAGLPPCSSPHCQQVGGRGRLVCKPRGGQAGRRVAPGDTGCYLHL